MEKTLEFNGKKFNWQLSEESTLVLPFKDGTKKFMQVRILELFDGEKPVVNKSGFGRFPLDVELAKLFEKGDSNTIKSVLECIFN